MGKNPNAKKNKSSRFKDKEFETDTHALEEEAARKGVSIWDLEQVKKDA